MRSFIVFCVVTLLSLNLSFVRPDSESEELVFDNEDVQAFGESFELMEDEVGTIVKAKVSLYMESLCPGCHSFIHYSLYPVFMKYSRFIQLDMLPYGNARHTLYSNGTYEFRCQHGPPECLGNVYLACATHLLQTKRPKHLIRYYNCLSSTSSSTIQDDVKTCAAKAGINFRRLDKCVHKRGPKILSAFGDRTNSLVGRRFVPTVVIDDKFDISEQDAIQSDLLGYLCKKFKGKKPTSCNTGAAVAVPESNDEQSNIKDYVNSALNMLCYTE